MGDNFAQALLPRSGSRIRYIYKGRGTSGVAAYLFALAMLPAGSIVLAVLLLGAFISHGFSGTANSDDSPRTNSGAVRASFVLVNPRQVPRLKRSFWTLLSTLASPWGVPSLRSTDDHQRTITRICESIRGSLARFAEDLGLIGSIKRAQTVSSNITIGDDWFSEALVQGSLLLRDLAGISGDIGNSIELYSSRYRNRSSERSEKQLSKNIRGVRFLGTLNDAADYGERLSSCLQQTTTEKFYDFGQNILNLARQRPRAVVKKLRSNLDQSPQELLDRDRSIHSFICLSITDKRTSREHCVRELARLEDCINRSKSSLENRIGRIPVKPWLRAVRQLSDCEIRGKTELLTCRSRRKVPRNIRYRVRYIYETILGRRISRRSPMNRFSNELAAALSKNEWGKRLVDELCEHLAIYQEGRRKLERAARIDSAKKEPSKRYRKMSESLEIYKKGLLLRTMSCIGKMHQAATEVEKFLIGGIKLALNETWKSHIRILSCLTDWMTKLFELYSGIDRNEASVESTTPMPAVTASYEVWYSKSSNEDSGLRNLAATGKRSELVKEVDRSVNNLMRAMNRASRMRSANDKSTLACLANNLLLVAMFAETLSFVSTLFCLGQQSNKKQTDSLEGQEDEWRNRKPRSLDFLDDETPARISNVTFPENTSEISMEEEENESLFDPTNYKNLNYEQFLVLMEMNLTMHE